MSLTQSLGPKTPVRQRSRVPKEQLFPIGELAREFGVTLRTLRFYEDRGLLTPHRDGNARFYSARDKARLTQILKAKQLGFTLGEIRDLLAKPAGIGESEGLPLLPEQIESQISHLRRQRDSIDEAIDQLRAALKV